MQGLRILFVAPRSAARGALVSRLQASGTEVTATAAVATAERLLSRHLWDAVLLSTALFARNPRELQERLVEQGYGLGHLVLWADGLRPSAPWMGLCLARMGTQRRVLALLEQLGAWSAEISLEGESIHDHYRRLLNQVDEGYWETDPTGIVLYGNRRLHDLSGKDHLAGCLLTDLFEATDAPLVRSMLAQQREGVLLPTNLRLRTHTGATHMVEVEPALASGPRRRRQGGAAFVRALGEETAAEAGRNRANSVLLAILTEMSRRLDVDEMLDLALREILTLLDLAAGCVWVSDEAGEIMGGGVTRGVVADPERRAALLGACRAWSLEVLRSRAPRVSRVVGEADGTPGQVMRAIGLVGAAAIPLGYNDRCLGVLWVASREASALDRHVVSLLISVSHHMALAVENARVYESRLQEERKRQQFYRDTVSAVSRGKLRLMEADEVEAIWECGEELVLVPLVTPADVGAARHATRSALRELGFSDERVFDMVTCVSEAATNAVKYGSGGWLAVRRTDEERIHVRVSDRGPGIDEHALPRALLQLGYSTTVSLGMGFSLMLDLADAVLISTTKEGTTLLLEMHLAGPPPEPLPDIPLD